jgi:hypothetical protein
MANVAMCVIVLDSVRVETRPGLVLFMHKAPQWAVPTRHYNTTSALLASFTIRHEIQVQETRRFNSAKTVIQRSSV